MDELKLGPIRIDPPPGFQLGSAIFVGPSERSEEVMSDPLTAHRAEQRPSINILPTDGVVAPESLGAYVEEQLSQLKALSRYEIIGLEPLQPKTGAAVLVRHRFMNEGVLYEQYQLYRSADDRTFIVTATHVAGTAFEKYEAIFRKALLSALS